MPLSKNLASKWHKGFKESSKNSSTKTHGQASSNLYDSDHSAEMDEINEYISKVKNKTGISHLWGTKNMDITDGSPEESFARGQGKRSDYHDSESDEDLRQFIEGLSDSEDGRSFAKSEKSSSRHNALQNIHVLPDLSIKDDVEEYSVDDTEAENHIQTENTDKLSSKRFNFVLDIDHAATNDTLSKSECISETTSRLTNTSIGRQHVLHSINSLESHEANINTANTLNSSEPEAAISRTTLDKKAINKSKHKRKNKNSQAMNKDEETSIATEIISEVKHSEEEKTESILSQSNSFLSMSRSSHRVSEDLTKSSSRPSSNKTSVNNSLRSDSSKSTTSKRSHRKSRKSDKSEPRLHRKKVSLQTDDQTYSEHTVVISDQRKVYSSDADSCTDNEKENISLPQFYSDTVFPPYPTPIMHHAIETSDINLLTNFSPATLALNDLMRFHLHLTNQYIKDTRKLYESYSTIIKKNHKYTTVKDTLKELQKKKRQKAKTDSKQESKD